MLHTSITPIIGNYGVSITTGESTCGTSTATWYSPPCDPKREAHVRQSMEGLKQELERVRIQNSFNRAIGAQTKKGEDTMKSLFNVTVVSAKEEILLDKKTVATDSDEAKFNLGVDTVIRDAGLKPKDVTVICTCLGGVKTEPEAQKVQVVKE